MNHMRALLLSRNDRPAFIPGALLALTLVLLLMALPVHAGAQMATAHFSYAQLALGYHFSVDSGPSALAVDGSGNVFVADNEVFGPILEITAASGYTTASPVGTGFWYPQGVVLDGNGNVFVADGGNGALKEILAAGGYTTVNTLAIGAIFPSGVAVDGSGNVYYSDNFHLQVIQLNYANAPTLNFGENITGVASPERTVTLQNIGNSPLTFPIPMAGSNPSISPHFALDSSATTACPLLTTSSAATATLAAGSACNLSVSFDPTAIASFSGSLSVTDNALNAPSPAYTTQIINLQGTAVPKQPQTITFAPIPATPLVTGTVSLTATASSGLPVTYTSATPTVCTVSGSTVTLVATGNCGIVAHQAGNFEYYAASAVGRNFTVTAH